MKPKILYVAGISNFVHPKNGGQIRTSEILKILCKQYQIDIFSPFLPCRIDSQDIHIKKNICPLPLKTLFKWAGRRGFSRIIDNLLTFYTDRSNNSLKNNQLLERQTLEKILAKKHWQYSKIFYDTSRYAPISPSAAVRTKSYLIAHNVDSILQPQSKFHHNLEASLCSLFKAVITCTEEDSKRLQKTSPGIECIEWANGTNPPTRPFTTRKEYDLLFVGALDYEPNIEAIQYIIKFLNIELQRLNINICIAGRGPSSKLRLDLTESGITLIANAPDLTEVYARSKVAIVPLFSGSGSRLKIAEALIHGLPVISTHIGAEGYPEDQKGLIRVSPTPINGFLEAIKVTLSNLNLDDNKLIAESAKRFLWHSTIDLNKLCSDTSTIE